MLYGEKSQKNWERYFLRVYLSFSFSPLLIIIVFFLLLLFFNVSFLFERDVRACPTTKNTTYVRVSTCVSPICIISFLVWCMKARGDSTARHTLHPRTTWRNFTCACVVVFILWVCDCTFIEEKDRLTPPTPVPVVEPVKSGKERER